MEREISCCTSNNCKRRCSHNNVDVVAIDCEMVGVGESKQSALARCTIVNYQGDVLIDCFVRPSEPITDYRTRYSGIMPHHMANAIPFNEARLKIKKLLKDKLVIGHALHMDFRVLRLKHPTKQSRDTSKYVKLRLLAQLPGSKTPSLRNLSLALLNRNIQSNMHCSLEDARAAMDLYRLIEFDWEEERRVTKEPTRYLCDSFWPLHITSVC